MPGDLRVTSNYPDLAGMTSRKSYSTPWGWSDREWSKKLGRATYELIYLAADIQLSTRHSLLIEFNFDSRTVTPHFMELKEKYGYAPVQIILEADDHVLLERFKTRAESGTRHPGNVDHTIYDEYRTRLAQGPYEPLAIGGCVLRVNTTDFAGVNYSDLLEQIKLEMKTRSMADAST